MASQNQIDANRRNAAKSTGPRSAGGKSVSRLNSIRLGIFCTAATLGEEDRADLAELIGQLAQLLEPVGPLEEIAVQRIAICAWRLERIVKIEAGVLMMHHFEHQRDNSRKSETARVLELFGSGPIPPSEETQERELEIDRAQKSHPSSSLGWAYLQDVGGPAALEKLTGYEKAIEASLFRWLAVLQTLQDRRGASGDAAVSPEVEIAIGPIVRSSADEAIDAEPVPEVNGPGGGRVESSEDQGGADEKPGETS